MGGSDRNMKLYDAVGTGYLRWGSHVEEARSTFDFNHEVTGLENGSFLDIPLSNFKPIFLAQSGKEFWNMDL